VVGLRHGLPPQYSGTVDSQYLRSMGETALRPRRRGLTEFRPPGSDVDPPCVGRLLSVPLPSHHRAGYVLENRAATCVFVCEHRNQDS
jgi:hypothetical protein